jgi:predicted transcriptional regulator
MQNRKTKLAKMRTTIIRRTLDEFVAMQVSSSSEKLNHIENYNRRLTHEDRERYKRARMPCPPCRIKSNYLEEIFSNKEFCKFFLHFVRNDKLYLYLTRTNKALVNEFKEKLITMARENAPVGVVAIEMEAATRKPLFVREIIEYINESRRIAQEYCKNEEYKNSANEFELEYESDHEDK